MQHTRRLIQHAKTTRRTSRGVRWLGRAWAVAALALGLAWLVIVSFGASVPAWTVATVLGAVGVATLAMAWLRRESDAELATHLDATLGLKSRLTNALYADTQADHPFAAGVIADAEQASEDGDRTLRKQIAAQASAGAWRPWRWAGPALTALALLVVLLPASFDPFGLRAAEAAEAQASAEEAARAEEAQARVEAARDLLEPLAETAEGDATLEDPQALLDELEAVMTRRDLSTPEGQREAQAELSTMREQVATEAERQRQAQDALEQSLSGLSPKNPGPADRFAEAMRRADFAEAARELDRLTRDADEGRMSEPQQERLEEQLREMQEQLEAQAEAQRERAEDETAGAEGAEEAAERSEQLADALERVNEAMAEDRSASDESAPAQQQLGELDRQQRDTERLREAERQLQEAQEQLASSPSSNESDDSGEASESQDAQSSSQTADASESQSGQSGEAGESSESPTSSSAGAQSAQGQPSSNAQGNQTSSASSEASGQAGQAEQTGTSSQPGQASASAEGSSGSERSGNQPESQPGSQPGAQPGSQPGGSPSAGGAPSSSPGATPGGSPSPGGTQPGSASASNGGNNGNGDPTQTGGPAGRGGVAGGGADGSSLFGQERGDPGLGTEAVRDIQDGEGWVIASWDNDDHTEGRAGPATVRFRQATTEARDAAERAVRDDRAPSRYHDAIRRYFDQLPAEPPAADVPNAPDPSSADAP